MKPKKLTDEQLDKVLRANEKHTMFTFDMTHPYYFVIENVFKDARKNNLVYFSKEEKKLVHIDLEGKLNTTIVQEWIEKYKKGVEDTKKKRNENLKKARESRAKKNTTKSTTSKKGETQPKTKSKSKTNTSRSKTTKKTTGKNTKESKEDGDQNAA